MCEREKRIWAKVINQWNGRGMKHYWKWEREFLYTTSEFSCLHRVCSWWCMIKTNFRIEKRIYMYRWVKISYLCISDGGYEWHARNLIQRMICDVLLLIVRRERAGLFKKKGYGARAAEAQKKNNVSSSRRFEDSIKKQGTMRRGYIVWKLF